MIKIRLDIPMHVLCSSAKYMHEKKRTLICKKLGSISYSGLQFIVLIELLPLIST